MTDQNSKKKRRDAILWTAAAIAAVVGGGIWLYEEYIEEYYIFPRWGEVEPDSIYRSGDPAPYTALEVYRENGIDRVIMLSRYVPDLLHHRKSKQATEQLGADFVPIPMPGDGAASAEKYARAIELMHESRQKGEQVLVHCAAGTNRTGGVVAAYELLVEGLPADQVYRHMKRYNFNPHENEKLLPFLNSNMKRIAELLVERGVIERVPESIPRIGPASAKPS